MLTALSIRDIVLIDRLELAFGEGLSVMTGETGAGKSILLDAFALALGARGDASLVREGAPQGQVTAVFELSPGHPVFEILADSGIDVGETLIVRRTQSPDGRTKAFVNDQPVSVQLMRRIGAALVEIHGQHDDRALTDPATHRQILDAYGGLTAEADGVAHAHRAWQAAETAAREHEAHIAAVRENADYLRHALEELQALDPQPDEEEALAERRQVMMHAEKIVGDLEEARDALGADGADNARLSAALRRLERQRDHAEALVAPVATAMERALIELNEARDAIEAALRATSFEPRDLEEAEERLFSLRALARKHQVPVTRLPELVTRCEAELASLDAGESELETLRAAARAAAAEYETAALALSDKRRAAARHLDDAVMAELGPLKLENARFITEIETSAPDTGGPKGLDRVAFWVQTNPGTKPGPMMKVASGGELARFILALKVVLAERFSAPTLIFDEIDTGVGGATAAAIGERLARLAADVQVLAVTHAPQVAAEASDHLRISKEARPDAGDAVVTRVSVLDAEMRREEIARMLAGQTVTDEARAAADRLIGGRA